MTDFFLTERKTVEKLLKLEKMEYAKFLKYVIGVIIKERTNLSEGILQEDKTNE